MPSTSPTSVGLAHYHSILNNKGIVDKAEKILRGFKPVTYYDVGMHVKDIETFEIKAVCSHHLFFSFSLPLPSVADLLDPFHPPPLDCQGEGDGSSGWRRVERSPSNRFLISKTRIPSRTYSNSATFFTPQPAPRCFIE
jgi:hypothetical protein